MNCLKGMKIYIVEINKASAKSIEEQFFDAINVEVVHADIKDFFEEKKHEIDCLVSPANAFGRMDGGYDAALSHILGWSFQYKVQDYIKDHFYGEQGVGTSFIIDTDFPNLKLIHTPTMQYPSPIKDPLVIYYAMRSTLICALQNDVKCMVLPLFGGYYGAVDAKVAAKMMCDAYDQILHKWGNI